MGIGGLFSGLMRSVGSVALFMPVISLIKRRSYISKSRLLMPLGFSAILGSTLTMVGSGPLIMLNSLLESVGGLKDVSGEDTGPIGFFAVFPVGLALLASGILYFLLLGRFFLPKAKDHQSNAQDIKDYFYNTYGIGGDLVEVKVTKNSPLVDQKLREWEKIMDPEMVIIAVKQGNGFHVPQLRSKTIKANGFNLLSRAKRKSGGIC